MAIYRPEQAQLTYGPEAAFAGDAEMAEGAGVSSGWVGDIAAADAGTLEVTLTQDSSNTAAPTVGDFIQIGEVIGLVGQANNEEGPHLHFEIWHNNLIIDPRNLIKDYKINDVSIKE